MLHFVHILESKVILNHIATMSCESWPIIYPKSKAIFNSITTIIYEL
jgi:hypothetical protein